MIETFKGQYEWLSNFWPIPIKYEGRIYPSVEHAYQASKSANLVVKRTIRDAPTAAIAKSMGKQTKLRVDWEVMKDQFMLNFLLQKFSFPDLQEKLLRTYPHSLVEGNYWHDTYWGICYCKTHKGYGKNILGRLLELVREKYSEQ